MFNDLDTHIAVSYTHLACITKEAAQQEEADTLLDKVFGGSAELLFASVLSGRKLKKEELERLRALVEAQEG